MNVLFDLGASKYGVWAIKKLLSPIQRWIYRISGGQVLSTLGQSRHVLLLTTRGHRTGKDRTTLVFYPRDGESIIICNVRPEFEPTNPWVINLRSHPFAWLQIGPKIAPYWARAATVDEIDRFWPLLIDLWPAFQVHFENGGRRSICILEQDPNQSST
jgi:deazaflavin-dependent oxidoreductase (nitroreductase family)